MLWFKIQCGLLRMRAGKEVRFAEPSAFERLRLLWIFRNFPTLPVEVLSARQRALVDKLYEESIPIAPSGKFPDTARVIGTVERPVRVAPKKPSLGEKVQEQALPIASGMDRDWTYATHNSYSVAGAPASRATTLRALAGKMAAVSQTLAATTQRTARVLNFSKMHLPVSSPRKGTKLFRASVPSVAARAQHAVAFAWKRRLGLAFILAIVSVLALAVVGNVFRSPVPEKEPDSMQASAELASPQPQAAAPVSSQVAVGHEGAAAMTSADADAEIHAIQKPQSETPTSPTSTKSVPSAFEPGPATPAPKEEASASANQKARLVAKTAPRAQPSTAPAAQDVSVHLHQGPRGGILFPNYPETAWRSRKRGKVTLRAQIAPAGTISKVEVLEGDPVLAEAARRAVRTWRYQQQSVPAEVVVHFNFINPEAISVQFQP